MENQIIGEEKKNKLISFRSDLINLIQESKENTESVSKSLYFSNEEKERIIKDRENWTLNTEIIIKIIEEQLKREFNYYV